MPDVPSAFLAPLLTALRTLPVWMFGALALAGWIVLFLPPFGPITAAQLAAFRAQWGVWIVIEAIAFSVLAAARIIEAIVTGYRSQRRSAKVRKALIFLPQINPWWYLAKQQDDSYVSQISMRIAATNLTDRPVRILGVRLIRPRPPGDVLHADVSLPMRGSQYHSSNHPVPANGTAEASLHIMVRGKLARQGRPIRVTIVITDQGGEEYRVTGIRIRSNNQPAPIVPWRARVAMIGQRLKGLFNPVESEPVMPALWQHDGKFDEIDLVLSEEKRNYAANGRTRGGLGSLNVTLQSEPGSGGTIVGTVPRLLWNREDGKPALGSDNCARLMRLYGALDAEGKHELEEYLLSHLNKASVYADVAYFIFLALHRMGRTIDALTIARAQLAGDRINAYSNLLGLFSGLVSREHFDMNPALYPAIATLLSGDTEHNFRLLERINLARLQDIDARQGGVAGSV